MTYSAPERRILSDLRSHKITEQTARSQLFDLIQKGIVKVPKRDAGGGRPPTGGNIATAAPSPGEDKPGSVSKAPEPKPAKLTAPAATDVTGGQLAQRLGINYTSLVAGIGSGMYPSPKGKDAKGNLYFSAEVAAATIAKYK
jgi:hypothetical protein